LLRAFQDFVINPFPLISIRHQLDLYIFQKWKQFRHYPHQEILLKYVLMMNFLSALTKLYHQNLDLQSDFLFRIHCKYQKGQVYSK
jgi:hypothetical protein